MTMKQIKINGQKLTRNQTRVFLVYLDSVHEPAKPLKALMTPRHFKHYGSACESLRLLRKNYGLPTTRIRSGSPQNIEAARRALAALTIEGVKHPALGTVASPPVYDEYAEPVQRSAPRPATLDELRAELERIALYRDELARRHATAEAKIAAIKADICALLKTVAEEVEGR